MRRSAYILLPCLLAPACVGEVVHRQYPTCAAAVAAGEQTRGWLPEWVPNTASDLHLQSDLDSNEWWLRFRLPGAARDSLKSRLTPADPTSVRPSKPGGAAWWFEGLVQNEPANDGALNAQIYRRCCDPIKRTIVLAFDRNTANVYVWVER